MQFDPLSPEFQRDPYPYYDMLRANLPIFYLGNFNLWFFTAHEDITTLLRDKRLGREIFKVMTRKDMGWDEPNPEYIPFLEANNAMMLFRDPPDHTRLRSMVHKAFTPRRMEQLREHIQEITHSLLDAVQDKGEMDIIHDLALPLPITVIAELLGIPEADRHLLHPWARALTATLEIRFSLEELQLANTATIEFSAYLKALADERRKNPQDDLITALVQVEEEGEMLTELEFLSTCILLLNAGHETTVNLIGNGALALLRHPDQLQKLKDDSTLAKNAVDEMLRYDSPVQIVGRWILEDFEYKGTTFNRGQTAGFMLGAANRDPAVYENPNEFDITRPNIQPMSFGHGIHYCLGAPLARLEAEIAFKTLVERMPNLALVDDDPKYRKTYVLRGLEALPVTF